MLQYPSMVRTPCTSIILGGFACLVLIPSVLAASGSLREEAVAYRTKGFEAQRQGDLESALAWYQKAAVLDPSYPTPLNDVGVIFEEQGRLEDAERAYQQALAVSPNYLDPHTNLAMLYERTGQKEKAIYHWMKRFQLGDPYDPWTARAEERLVALGVLRNYPGLKGRLYTRRRVTSQELEDHSRSLEEYHALTEQRDDWQ